MWRTLTHRRSIRRARRLKLRCERLTVRDEWAYLLARWRGWRTARRITARRANPHKQEGDNIMDLISDDALDRATEAFHAALDRHVHDYIHGRAGDWVDGSAEAVVEALLIDGWKPPEPAGSAS